MTTTLLNFRVNMKVYKQIKEIADEHFSGSISELIRGALEEKYNFSKKKDNFENIELKPVKVIEDYATWCKRKEIMRNKLHNKGVNI